ncbi:MAG: energy transducer TonB [Vicinamibacterales bacterium]
MRTIRPALILALALTAAPAAGAQPALQSALSLYGAASYDEALRALDDVRGAGLEAGDLAVVEQYRMLCLTALGRTAEAEAAAAALLELQPDFVLTADDASPRVRAMVDAQRARVVPARARRAYAEAKAAYDAGDFVGARDQFTSLAAWLARPEVLATDAALADLLTLSDGFTDLVAAAIAHESSARDRATVQAAMAAMRTPSPVEAVAAQPLAIDAAALPPAAEDRAVVEEPDAPMVQPEPPPFAPLDIYTHDWRSADVTPPSPLEQPLSGWWGSMGEPAPGTALGVVDLVIGRDGRVESASIYRSVNRVYDAVLLESVRQWRYRPATRGGRAVPYRRITGVVSGPGASR